MTHTVTHTTLLFLGQMAGWLGVTIAVYLQLISPRRCKLEYVIGFYLSGLALILVHIGVFHIIVLDGWLPAIGYVIIIVLYLYAAYWVHRHADLPGPREVLKEYDVRNPLRR